MICAQDMPNGSGCHWYRASVPSTRPALDYTPLITTRHAGLSVPLEDNWILWQK